MTNIWFTARKPFDPSGGEAWTSYLAWANLPHLREVISLDILLCPDVLPDLIAEDWEHNIHQDWYTYFFHDLNYLRARTGDQAAHILAVMREPAEDPRAAFTDAQFAFLGYDLVEAATGISALTNCGGFDQAFTPADLSDVGLLRDFDAARAVQARLRHAYPHEQHADCDLWAIWKLI
ncbi:MAG TPA: hypothetical protein VFZ66_06500 [Herpetosiphonaceae bacterium]